MKAKNVAFPSSLRRIRTDNLLGTKTYEAMGAYNSFVDVVTCGGVIKGNFKDPNPWSFNTSTRVNDNPGIWATYSSSDKRYFDEYYGSYKEILQGQILDTHSGDIAEGRARALEDLNEAIRGSLDLSVDAFQIKQTAKTHRDVRKVVREMGSIYRKLGPDRILRPMKAAGSAWLIFTYGVKPTLQSMYDTTRHTGIHYTTKPQIYRGRGRVTRDVTKNTPGWPDTTFEKSSIKMRGRYRSEYMVKMRIPDSPLTRLARLTSLNPVSIAWELLPWSFVVDWVFNIGDYLRGIETALVYDRYFAGGYVTSSYIVNSVQTATRSGGDVPGAVWTGRYAASATDRGSQREVLTSYPKPAFPRIRPELGSGRLLNAAALLTTFIRR